MLIRRFNYFFQAGVSKEIQGVPHCGGAQRGQLWFDQTVDPHPNSSHKEAYTYSNCMSFEYFHLSVYIIYI